MAKGRVHPEDDAAQLHLGEGLDDAVRGMAKKEFWLPRGTATSFLCAVEAWKTGAPQRGE